MKKTIETIANLVGKEEQKNSNCRDKFFTHKFRL